MYSNQTVDRVILAIKVISALIIVAALVGCASKPREIVVTETKYQVISIPSHYFDLPSVASPPDKDAFVAGDFRVRVDMLVDYSRELLAEVINLTNRLKAIQELQSAQIEYIDKEMNE